MILLSLQWQVLNSNYCTGQRGFKLLITVNAFTTVRYTEADSMWGIKGLYSALRPTLKGSDHVLLRCDAVCLAGAYGHFVGTCRASSSWYNSKLLKTICTFDVGKRWLELDMIVVCIHSDDSSCLVSVLTVLPFIIQGYSKWLSGF